jgi:RluA family pseudouridine synthase
MPPKVSTRPLPRGLRLLFHDRDLIVVDKPPGLLSIATDRDETSTALSAVSDWVRKGQLRSRESVHVVHRIDRDTSGVLIFARSEEMRDRLQAQWTETTKIYQAVLHGQVGPDAGVLEDWLLERNGYRVHRVTEAEGGYFSRTGFRVIERSPHLTLVELDLLTGRKHQIRAQWAVRGHPVVGDRIYGPGDRATFRRLGLHARSLSFPHPRSGERVLIETEVPAPFRSWMRWDGKGVEAATNKPAPPRPSKRR